MIYPASSFVWPGLMKSARLHILLGQSIKLAKKINKALSKQGQTEGHNNPVLVCAKQGPTISVTPNGILVSKANDLY